MERKDYEPIKFEIFQSDMENQMFVLHETIKFLKMLQWLLFKTKVKLLILSLEKIKQDLQHKINWHIENGDWK